MTLATLDDASRKTYEIAADIEGVVVTDVAAGSPAAERRIVAGDVIVEIGQEAMKTPEDVSARIEELKGDGRRNTLVMVSNKTGELRFVSLRWNRRGANRQAAPLGSLSLGPAPCSEAVKEVTLEMRMAVRHARMVEIPAFVPLKVETLHDGQRALIVGDGERDDFGKGEPHKAEAQQGFCSFRDKALAPRRARQPPADLDHLRREQRREMGIGETAHADRRIAFLLGQGEPAPPRLRDRCRAAIHHRIRLVPGAASSKEGHHLGIAVDRVKERPVCLSPVSEPQPLGLDHPTKSVLR